MESPSVGSAALTPSPSNFSTAMERANAADDAGSGFSQPKAVRVNQPRQAAQNDNDIDPSRIERQLDGSQAGDPDREVDQDQGDEILEDPNADPGQEQLDPQEQAKAEFMGKLAEALEQGKLPIDVLGDMLVTVALPGGREVDVPLNELKRGFMRQSDFTRKSQETAQVRDQAQNLINLERQRRQDWQNEDRLIAGLSQMGLAQAFDRAVMRYAKQQVDFRQLPKPEQDRILMQRQFEQQKQFYESQQQELLQRLQQQQPQNQQAEVTRHFSNQLSQMLPSAFKEFGLTIYPLAKERFMKNLETLYQGGACTRELVNDACRATREELDDYARSLGDGVRPQRTNALPPRRASGSAGPGVQSFTGNGKRSRPSAFGTRFSGSGM